MKKYGYILLVAILASTALLSARNSGVRVDNYDSFSPWVADSTDPDSLRYPYVPSGGGLFLKDPSNIKEHVTYDPELNMYVITRKIGDVVIGLPRYLTPEEYRESIFQEQSAGYWEAKAGSNAGARRDEPNDGRDPGSGLIPQIEVGGERFRNIFGSNFIEIRPQGAATLTLGGRFQRIDNPTLPERNRSTFNLVFDQRIQMNVTGKIGTRLNLQTNYDTEATFAFENTMKTEFRGEEDDIFQSIEVGNVNLPLNSSLISGAQSLFGVKTQMQFGRTTVTTLISEQRSQSSSVNVQGGGMQQEFMIQADQYEANRHYFLSHYFRDNYERFLRNAPVITSPVQITRIEVYVTNRRSQTEDVRNIVAFMDLGEADNDGAYRNSRANIPGAQIFSRINDRRHPTLPHNQINSLNPRQLDQEISGVRAIANANTALENRGFVDGIDFTDLANARKLTPQEYSFHPQLGYITLNQALNQDEVLAVAYQYTANGVTYQVGEFGNDGIMPPNTLILKMLKSVLLDVRLPMWDLMMKNVYSLNAFGISQEDFRLDVLFWNDETGVPIPFLPSGNLNEQLLLRVMELDRVNQNLDPMPDGFFDFIPDITIKPQNGRIIFPVIEPFGSNLKRKLDPEFHDRYVFQQLYDSTRFRAQEETQLNKYFLRGRYKSSSGSEIMLNAVNIPPGSVVVTAGGARLTEDVDYTVDYNLGRVRILNEGILQSGMPIKVDFENNTLFNVQTRQFFGLNVDHRVNENLNIGGSFLHLRERPLTQKANIGEEPIANSIWGMNTQFQRDAPYLTRLVDNIPFISTKERSTISFQGEFAHLIPGSPRAIRITDDETTYIDDFESSQTFIDIRNPMMWTLASTPGGQPDLFPETEFNNDIRYGYNRARLAWYTIDPIFHLSNASTPQNIRENKELQSGHYVREILFREVFPNMDRDPALPRNIPSLDIAYYPRERGPYNFDVSGEPGISSGINDDGTLRDPQSRWAGIMRHLQTNNFEEQNIEFLQFWLLDPFLEDPTLSGGDLYINLGNVSEDILKDGRQSFENGLPLDGDPSRVDSTAWGLVPKIQPQVIAFDNDPNAITIQDVGLDGLSDAQERNYRFRDQPSYLERLEAAFGTGSLAYQRAFDDPAADNFSYYRSSALDDAEADILQRYRFFNNPEGNSNTTQPEGFPSAATTRPDIEDINQDQTLSRSEAYFQYRISMRQQDLVVGQNHITDIFETQTGDLPDGTRKTARWIQFKVPVFQPDRRVGPISDFRSIRFIRIFMSGFSDPIVLRMARLEFLRGEWRRYMFSLDGIRDELEQDEDFQTTFETNVVNLEENGQRSPINYTLPPGIDRQQFFQTSSIQAQNEQSLSMSVCNLRDGDARAIFRNLAMDMRLYKRLRMFVHVEERLPQEPVRNGDLNVFIRVGSDYNQNYYEYELPTTVTPWGATDPREIWPEENEMIIDLEQLREVKLERDRVGTPLRDRYTKDFGAFKITVVGAPNLGNVRTIMIGVRNPKKLLGDVNDDGLPKCAEIWVNELRLGGFDRQGGFAANARMNAQLADFGNITLTGNYSSIAFGGLDQSVTERSQEEIMSYDLQTSWELGKFFSEKVKLRIPLFYSMAEEWRNPRFNPLDPDIEFRDALANIEDFAARDSIRKIAQTYNMRRSVNFANVRKERSNNQRKPTPFDVENIALSYAFSEHLFRDINTVFDVRREHRAAINYSFQSRAKPWEPFKTSPLFKNKNLALIRDLSFGYMPSRMVFRMDANRMYNEMQMRNTDSPLFQLDTTHNKTFTLNRQYDIGYDLTKALRIDFQARMNTWIDELPGSSRDSEVRESIRQSLREFGRPVRYNQTLSVNWEAPIKKLPYLDFVSTVNVRYTGDFDWQANSLIAQMAGPDDDSLNLGNTIQNASSVQINGQLNFVTLYNKSKFLREINQGKQRTPQRGGAPQRPGMQRGGREAPVQEEEEKPNVFMTILKSTTRVMMSLRSANFSMTQTEGTLLPGFLPQPQFFGMAENWSAPTPGFVFGSQNDIRPIAAEREWLSTSPLQNNQFNRTFNQNLNARATIEPVRSLRLELTATQNRSESLVEFFRYNPDEDRFESQSPFFTGMFTTSVIAIGTSFESVRGPEFTSEVYNQFLANREVISRRRAQAFAIDNTNYIPEITGSPDSANFGYEGFSYTSQGVLIPSFIAAYLGESAADLSLNPDRNLGIILPNRGIPLPNWRLTYDGFTKLKPFSKYFTSFVVNHAYVGNFTVGGFNTNLQRQQMVMDGEAPIDENGDFMPENQVASVSITEQFAPLIGFNARMKNSITARLEYKRDRNILLSLANNQITETRGNEVVIGGGYIIKDLRLRFVSVGAQRSNPVSNLELRLDLSIRDNQTVIRRIVEQLDQVTAGQTITSIKFSADYAISQRVNVQVFYDQIVSNYKISTAFPTSNTNVGFRVRLNLGS